MSNDHSKTLNSAHKVANAEVVDDANPIDEALGETGEDDIEFSLDQLSHAYAKVIRGNTDNALATEPGDVDAGQGNDVSIPTEEPDPVELDDKRDDAPCPLSEVSVLETILFVGTPPDVRLTAKKLAGMMRDVSPKEIPTLVEELNQKYQRQNAAYRIVQESGGYSMTLAEDLAEIRNQFYGEVRDAQLTQPAIEVLSVVAYNQPIARVAIDRIRQRPSGAVLSQLVERRLLAIDPESESSKERRYITTSRFLELFGLTEIGDLPQAQEVENIDDFFG